MVVWFDLLFKINFELGGLFFFFIYEIWDFIKLIFKKYLIKFFIFILIKEVCVFFIEENFLF